MTLRRPAVVLVRTARGACHIARATPDRRGRYTVACWRTVTPGRDGVVYARPREIRQAWRLDRVCRDCVQLADLPPARFLRATGW